MKWTQNVGKISLALLLAVILGASGTMMVNGSNKLHSAMTHALAETAVNEQQEVVTMDFSNEPENVIYLAGGCFGGIEHQMQSIPGVIDAQSGYANGRRVEDANYQTICYTDTGFRETVRVEYDPEQVSLDALLMAYFYVIDPKLTAEQYDVTQKSGTEYPFRNKFWNQFRRAFMWISLPASRCFHPPTSLKAAAAGPHSPSPSRSRPSSNWWTPAMEWCEPRYEVAQAIRI